MDIERKIISNNYVDLMSGTTSIPITLWSGGQGDRILESVMDIGDGYPNNSLWAGIRAEGNQTIAYLGLSSEILVVNSTYAAYKGSKVVINPDGSVTYTFRDGTEMHIPNASGFTGPADIVRFPSGRVLRFSAGTITQNDGLMATGGYLVNLAYKYCPAASPCSGLSGWPSGSVVQQDAGSVRTRTATDSRGAVHVIKADLYNQVLSYQPPGTGAAGLITYDKCNRTAPYDCYRTFSNGIGGTTTVPLYAKTISSTRNGQTWSYNFQWNLGTYYNIYQETSPTGIVRKAYFYMDPQKSWPIYLKDDNFTYNYAQNESRKIISLVLEEGNLQQISYDARANVISITEKAKPGSGAADQVTTFGYDATCVNYKTCNKPNWVIDPRGARTDYTYHASSGHLLSETGPAVNGVRPVHRYAYVQRRAWYLNSTGQYVQDPDPIWLLDTAKFCTSGATIGDTCEVAGAEVVKRYEYGPDSGPNNLWLRGIAEEANGEILRTCFVNDKLGRKISETTAKGTASLQACP